MMSWIRSRTVASLSLSVALIGSLAGGCSTPPYTRQAEASVPPPANRPMQRVLDQLVALNGKPIEECTPDEARKQPSPTDAVVALLKRDGKPTTPPPGIKTAEKKLATTGGDVNVRIYTPDGVTSPAPTIVYVHGGGWVIATLDTYDSSCRALATGCHANVISVDYSYAPEHPFPAAHEQVYAVLQYVFAHPQDFGADAAKIAIAGESAGGNMATAACLMAKDRGGKLPVAQLLVYPVTQPTMDTPSYLANAHAKPLNKAMMKWFARYTFAAAGDVNNKYFAVLFNKELAGLPPATVITAEIDPLHDDGEWYAAKLKKAGVDTVYKNYDGVTHEFFGMGAVLPEAAEAEKLACDRLNAAFAR